MESLKEIKQPDIIGIVETHLKEDEEVMLEGYQIIRKDRNCEGGGLLLGIKKFINWWKKI